MASGDRTQPVMAVFGHRGARGLLPENTLPGFAIVGDLDLTGAEFDVALTKDGVAVVHHDPRLHPDHTRDEAGMYLAATTPLLRDTSLAALGHYDVGRLRAGSADAGRYPEQQAVDGARIPTLDDVIAALHGRDLLIEVKTFPDRPGITATPEEMAVAVIGSLRRHDAIENAVLFAFDWRVLRAAAEREPALRRCCLTEPDTVKAARLWLDGWELDAFDGKLPRVVAATGAAFWAPFHASLDETEVREAQALGLRVVPWTVNTIEAFDRMIRFGVDGMISDRPDLARRAVEGAGLRVAPPGFVAGIGG